MHGSRQVFAAVADTWIAIDAQIATGIQVWIGIDQIGGGTVKRAELSEFGGNELLRIVKGITPPIPGFIRDTTVKNIGNLAIRCRGW